MAVHNVGGIDFANAASLKDYTRKLLMLRMGNRIEIEDLERKFLADLLSYHDSWDEKCAGGIVGYFAEWDHRSKGMKLILLIGEEEKPRDISWIKACTNVFRRSSSNSAKQHRQRVLDAMRLAVVSQIDEFKRQARRSDGSWTSKISGEVIFDRRQAHADHYPVPFVKIAQLFVDDAGGWDKIAVEDRGLEGGYVLSEPWLGQWCDYHRRHARLRILTAEENLGQNPVTLR